MGPPAQDATAAASSSSPSGGSSRRRGPRLERRNASKHIPYQYDPELYCSYPPSSSPSPTRPRASSSGPASAAPSLSCSVDLSSFRIGGSGDGGGDVQLLCRNLGLSGPDEFAISLTDWEAHKAYRSSSSASSSPSSRSQPDRPQPRESPLRPDPAEIPAFSLAADSELPAKQTTPIQPPARPAWLDPPQEPARPDPKKPACEGGIKGIRPPPVMLKPQPTMLKPPPSMARLPQSTLVGSTWDILQSFAPEEQGQAPAIRSSHHFGGEEDEDEAEVLTLDDLRLGDTSEEFTGMSSISTTNDDETNDSMFYISPNGRFKRKIRSWSRGMLLGSGSFGTVYEGISDEGVFFAVKEVPLHDQGSNAESFGRNEEASCSTAGYQLMDECSQAGSIWLLSGKKTNDCQKVECVQDTWNRLRSCPVLPRETNHNRTVPGTLKLASCVSDFISESDLMLSRCYPLINDILDPSSTPCAEPDDLSWYDKQLEMGSVYSQHALCVFSRDSQDKEDGFIDLSHELLFASTSATSLGKLISSGISSSDGFGNISHMKNPTRCISKGREQLGHLTETLLPVVPSKLSLSLRGPAFVDYLSSTCQISQLENLRLSENKTGNNQRRCRRPRHYLSSGALSLSPEGVELLAQSGRFGDRSEKDIDQTIA